VRRTIEMVHGKFKAVLREPRRVFKKDFDEDFLKKLGREDQRIDEYTSLGFPVWIRPGLEGIEIPKIEYEKLEECGNEWMFEKFDFEGADRKYTLLADLFHNKKICFEGSGEEEVNLRGNVIDTLLFVVNGDTTVHIDYSGGFRVSSGRFLVKEGATLVLEDASISEGVEISSYYFYLEKGASLEIRQGLASSGKSAKYILIEGEDFEANVLPRVGVINGAVDIMYSSKVSDSSSVVVNGRGFSKSGKVIFRGVMDAKKGSKNANVSEHFECLFLDDEASFEAIPSLFVSENELSAEHGATAYSIPYDEVFYMMSRGFSSDEISLTVAKGILDGFDKLQNWTEKIPQGVSR
jgi:hypothetical protein